MKMVVLSLECRIMTRIFNANTLEKPCVERSNQQLDRFIFSSTSILLLARWKPVDPRFREIPKLGRNILHTGQRVNTRCFLALRRRSLWNVENNKYLSNIRTFIIFYRCSTKQVSLSLIELNIANLKFFIIFFFELIHRTFTSALNEARANPC